MLLLSIFTFFLPLAGEGGEPALFEAIDRGDYALVQRLVEQGADLAASDGLGQPPLVRAINARDLVIIEYLLHKGADPNQRAMASPLPGGDSTAYEIALATGNQAVINLMVQYGAQPYLAQRFYSGRLLNFLRLDNVPEAKRLIASGKASLETVDDISLLYIFETGNEEIRAFIRSNGPAGIATGSFNLLDAILSAVGITEDFFSTFPFPMATTFLSDETRKFPRRCDANKAFDGDVQTSWVEGVGGPGIGQKLAFIVEPDSKKISIMPGYADGINFIKNNRLKKARLSFYLKYEDVTQLNTTLILLATDYSLNLVLQDLPQYQDFDINLPPEIAGKLAKTNRNACLVCVLEIQDVYKGSTRDDTCIAEIKVN